MVIADLHIGFEESVAQEGVYIPKLLREIIDTTRRIIERERPKVLVINGDLKHSFTPLKREFLEVGAFLREVKELVDEVVLVKGNHDTGINWIREKFGVEIVESLEIRGWTIAHGHLKVEGGKVIIGHEHPSIRLRDEVGASVKVPVFLKGSNILVLPAFSPWAYGNDLTVNEPISPVLRNFDLENLSVVATTGEELLNFGKFGDLIRAMRLLG